MGKKKRKPKKEKPPVKYEDTYAYREMKKEMESNRGVYIPPWIK